METKKHRKNYEKIKKLYKTIGLFNSSLVFSANNTFESNLNLYY